jgi:quinol monooxygenase YgiN
VIVVNRFRTGEGLATSDELRRHLHDALDALRTRPGFVDGEVARNLDEPDLWLLTTRWRDVGSYRRALSSYDVKMAAVPTLSRAVDEPSAYGPVGRDDRLDEPVPRQLD